MELEQFEKPTENAPDWQQAVMKHVPHGFAVLFINAECEADGFGCTPTLDDDKPPQSAQLAFMMSFLVMDHSNADLLEELARRVDSLVAASTRPTH